MIHELKTDPEQYELVAANLKKFEIRKHDREYKAGDILVLRKTRWTGQEMREGKPLEYTGEMVKVFVTHVMHGPMYGLREGWSILSIVVQ